MTWEIRNMTEDIITQIINYVIFCYTKIDIRV